VSDRPQAVLST